jgi:hypothetical protein
MVRTTPVRGAVLGILLAAALGAGHQPVNGTALVRFVDAIADKPVNLAVGGRPLFTNVTFKTATDYAPVANGTLSIVLRRAASDGILAERRASLLDGRRYTIVARRTEDGAAELGVLEDAGRPQGRMARLRVIHAVPGAAAVRVGTPDEPDPVVDGVTADDWHEGYEDVEPQRTTLIVFSDDDERRPLARLARLRLEAGHAYTIVLTSRDGRRIEPLTLSDAETPALTPD